MARIYIEYAGNLFMAHPDYFMLSVFVITSLVLVSAQDVLNNIPKDNLSNTFNFFMAAIRDTSWIIQALIAGFFIRVIVSGTILAYKNMNRRWLMIKLRY